MIEPDAARVEGLLENLRGNGQMQRVLEAQKELPFDVTAGALRTIEERVAGTDREAALVWLKGGTATAPEASTPQTAITVSSPEEARRLGPDVYYRNPEGKLYKTPAAEE